MRSSRGMGAVRTSKMPKGSTITRKDNPGKVKMFAKGGTVKKMAAGGTSEFGAAFRAARKEQGDGGTFTFKGKKYTTDMAKPAAPKPAAPKPAAPKPAAPTATAAKAPAYVPRAPSQLTAQTYAANKKPMVNTATTPANQTPYQMSQQMKRDAAPPPRKGITFSEAMAQTGAAEKARNDKRDAQSAVDAKRRGKSVERLFMGKSYYDKYPEERPDYLKRGDEANQGFAKGGSANFIKGAIKKPGALRASLGAKPGKPIPAGKLDKASKAPGKLGQRARFAEMLRGFRKNKKQDG